MKDVTELLYRLHKIYQGAREALVSCVLEGTGSVFGNYLVMTLAPTKENEGIEVEGVYWSEERLCWYWLSMSVK